MAKASPAYKKYQSPRYKKEIREAAKDLAVAVKARKKIGAAALGKPKSSRVQKDYAVIKREYGKRGRKLAKLTGYEWK